MTKKEQILQMYFEEHKIQDMIAKSLGVSQSYISQVITNDERYCQEKEKRHNEAMERKAEYNKQYFKTYERHKKWGIMKAKHYLPFIICIKERIRYYNAERLFRKSICRIFGNEYRDPSGCSGRTHDLDL